MHQENEMSLLKTLATAVAAMLLFVAAFVVTSPAFAEETRRLEVVGFDFASGEVVLEDEDGFVWSCPFGTEDWAIGEEYLLILSDDGSEEIVEAGFGSSLFFLRASPLSKLKKTACASDGLSRLRPGCRWLR